MEAPLHGSTRDPEHACDLVDRPILDVMHDEDRALVGVEMLAAVPWGLGWMIFGAREFLNTDVMMAGIAVIGIIGLTLEKFVFQKIENYTVVRWGMVTA